MNIPNNQWNDKTADEIRYMNIPEGLFEKSDKNISLRILDAYFDPTTANEIRECIGTIYIYVVLFGGKGEIRHVFSEISRQGLFPAPNLGHHGTGRDIHCQIIPNLGIKENPKISGEKYGHPNWYITLPFDFLNNHMK